MFLPGVELVPGLRPVRDFEEALRQKDLVIDGGAIPRVPGRPFTGPAFSQAWNADRERDQGDRK